MIWNGVESYSEATMPLGIIKTLPRHLFCAPSVNVNRMGSQSTGRSSTEKLGYELGSAEPALQSKYDHGPCIDRPGVHSNTVIVDDLGEHEDTYGCGDFEGGFDGKFPLQAGDNVTIQRAGATYRDAVHRPDRRPAARRRVRPPPVAPLLVTLEEAELLRRVRHEEVLRPLLVQHLHPC
ncbi:hypothetical protein ACFW2Y_10530 [Streptomyces sp. NPDC058877]|uniref:hypothetical protein n=1 Tax=unclassified Streptomyces TaxID=2593676 RepID=UPI0036974FA5